MTLINEILAAFPHAQRQQLTQLARNAKKEFEGNICCELFFQFQPHMGHVFIQPPPPWLWIESGRPLFHFPERHISG